MKNVILFDRDDVRSALLPLTFTRPVGMVRFGIMTQIEKWRRALPDADFSPLTQDYLSAKYPALLTDDDYYIAAHLCPEPSFVEAVSELERGAALADEAGNLLAWHGSPDRVETYGGAFPLHFATVTDIFMKNGQAIEADFSALTTGRVSCELSETNRVVGDVSRVFVEEGATVECAIINTKGGPVYIGRDAEVMEGACLRGPIAMCEHSVVNMGGKIYGATTLGPYCKVGGELNNVVMTGYSNKAHDGFLGNAVVGEWCNLGAGCTASNLKNTYVPVRVWSYATQSFTRTSLQFCGLIMGDHSKAGINTMFNTATVVGVGVNFYGSGFPRTFIPSFMQGTTAGMEAVAMNRFFDTAERMMARRHVPLTEDDKAILNHIRSIDN